MNIQDSHQELILTTRIQNVLHLAHKYNNTHYTTYNNITNKLGKLCYNKKIDYSLPSNVCISILKPIGFLSLCIHRNH